MKVYRIAKKKFIQDLKGTGSKKYGGRWNHKGTPILYTSENISLAVLEILVHVNTDNLPSDLKLLTLYVPDDVNSLKLNVKDLPKEWRDYPAPNILANIGSEWANDARSLVLFVPSVVIPEEKNLLINPRHPDFEEVVIDEIKDFRLDERFTES